MSILANLSKREVQIKILQLIASFMFTVLKNKDKKRFFEILRNNFYHSKFLKQKNNHDLFSQGGFASHVWSWGNKCGSSWNWPFRVLYVRRVGYSWGSCCEVKQQTTITITIITFKIGFLQLADIFWSHKYNKNCLGSFQVLWNKKCISEKKRYTDENN